MYRAADDFAALLERGRELRERQSTAGGPSSADSLREAARQRREAIDRLVATAETMLVDDGHAASRSTLGAVRQTLEALSSRSADATPDLDERAGTLVRELEPPAFEGLMVGFVPSGTGAGEDGDGPDASEKSEASAGRSGKQRGAEVVEIDAARARRSRARGAQAEAAADAEPAKPPRVSAARAKAVAERRRLQVLAEKTRAALEGLGPRSSELERERSRTERDVAKKSRAVERQRERLERLQEELREAKRSHDAAVRAHRRSELERLELEERLDRTEEQLAKHEATDS